MVSSTEEADETINICARCREAATQLCNGCRKAPDAEGGHVETVWYCSAKCQKADWRFHKLECKKAQARRSLYRVAETAKLAFFRLVERIFDLDVVGLEAKGDTLYIQEGPKDRSIFNPFSSEHLTSDQDKQAAMAWMNCGSSEDYVQVLVEAMLQDVPFKVAEVLVPRVKYLRRVVVIEPDGHESDSSKTEHVIFKITINEDEDYALDVTGAQFGFYDPITPWIYYQQTRIETLGGIRPLKHLRDSHRLPSKDFSKKNGWDVTRKALNGQFAKIFGSASKSWQVKNGALSAMLKLSEEAFRKRQGELLDFIDERIGARKKQLQEAKDSKKEALRAS
ncbi:MAG: hypothetical protein ALECFALPRED_010650 [Alectoria fallacina]|uniref:MYND-type domain-containing protein n=1 Tax=Alectoria fallacina TaxID=1903189 RepID=A0A8H3EG07_9LECA|nr:MAG: hypothetical protein ALECFALPRED_010650 [Alectoria fallacina]